MVDTGDVFSSPPPPPVSSEMYSLPLGRFWRCNGRFWRYIKSLPHSRFWRCILSPIVDSGDVFSSPWSILEIQSIVSAVLEMHRLHHGRFFHPYLLSHAPPPPPPPPQHTSVAGLFKQHPSDVHHYNANIHSLSHTTLHTTFYVSHNKFFCIRSIHPTIIGSRSPTNHHC